jgi:hypothetical protein
VENNVRCVECCSAGERAGLYYTCIMAQSGETVTYAELEERSNRLAH